MRQGVTVPPNLFYNPPQVGLTSYLVALTINLSHHYPQIFIAPFDQLQLFPPFNGAQE